MYLSITCRNSDHHGRPSFASLLEALSGPSQELLRVPEESLREVNSPDMAAQIGADGPFLLTSTLTCKGSTTPAEAAARVLAAAASVAV